MSTVAQPRTSSVTDILKDAYEDSLRSEDSRGVKPRKKRRGAPQPADPELIESVRASLEKGEGDRLVDSNVYEPDNSPKNEKSNKRRQRRQEEVDTTGVDNPTFEHEEGEAKRHTRRKQRVTSPEPEQIETPNADTGPERKPRRLRTRNAEELRDGTPDMSPEHREQSDMRTADTEPERRTRRRRTRNQEEHIDERPDDTLSPSREATSEEPREERTRRRHRRRPPPPEVNTEATSEEVQPAPAGAVAEPPPPVVVEVRPEEIPDEGRVISVTIHRTDRLRTDLNVSHPLVRVHVFDSLTGEYIKKQHRDRKVTSYYEDIEKVDYILPVLTHPWDFKRHKSTLPIWEEQLVFNENFHYLSENPRAVMCFEVLDMLSATTVMENNAPASDGGWFRIAWAFLKPFGANGLHNVDKKVRLQLYEPGLPRNQLTNSSYVFDWYRSGTRVPYPSTLYVSVLGIRMAATTTMTPEQRSLFPNQMERGSHDPAEVLGTGGDGEDDLPAFRLPTQWTRLSGQMCKVPNRLGLTLTTGTMGCNVVKFSKDGAFLACGCQDKTDYPVLVYEFPSGKLKCRLVGHNNLIYTISWSRKSHYLVSASSDGTARVWSLSDARQTKCLAHPCFVYTTEFHPRNSTIIVSGGFDRTLRVWSVEGEKADLVQEMEGHGGMVNSVCFDQEGKHLYSADSVGMVCVWNVHVTEQKGRRGFLRDWTLLQKITDKETEGVVINHIEMHPSGKRLLLHTRDNTIRMLDLRVGVVMLRYQGALNYREHLRSCITPCGSFVISGSEDKAVYVWNAETGDHVAVYRSLNLTGAVCTVDYHPLDHSVALSAVVPNAPILIYGYDAQIARFDTGMYTYTSSPRSASPDIVNVESLHELESTKRHTSRTVKEQEEKLNTIRSERVQEEADRYRRAMQRLNTVVHQSSLLRSQGGTLSDDAFAPVQKGMGTWGHERTGFEDITPRLSLEDQARQVAAQKDYMGGGSLGWRPQFIPVGKAGSLPSGRPPQLAMTSSGTGKASFSFHDATKSATQEAPPKETVVAVYDYQAQRSDELNFFRGDIIAVLLKDNDNWWMGQLADGSQGFFPTNYVTGDDEIFQRKPERKNGLESTFDSEEQLRNYSDALRDRDDLVISREPRESRRDQAEAAKTKRPPRRKKRPDEQAADLANAVEMLDMGSDLPPQAQPQQNGQPPKERRRRPRSRQRPNEETAT